ncbi:MAG: LytTR family DNA-binding domain-containing protein [Prevotella sp.]|nr:LytTR family DNA-binding domain-containing protein [Prevotella sp.]
MIRVLAIDDEPLALQQLAAYIRKMSFFELCGECMSALEAREIMEHEVIDAIFCDINMPDLTGMDFVRQLVAPPLIVFTTAYAEYAIDGYRVNAIDYLLKPFGLQEFQRAAIKVRDMYNLQHANRPEDNTTSAIPTQPSSADDTIFIKTDSRTVRISISDIRYVEAMSEYLKLHLDSQPRPLITYLSMKKMEEFLPDHFMRIHRSYIINLDKVQEVNKNRVIMGPDEYLPIGDNYREAFNSFLNGRILTK